MGDPSLTLTKKLVEEKKNSNPFDIKNVLNRQQSKGRAAISLSNTVKELSDPTLKVKAKKEVKSRGGAIKPEIADEDAINVVDFVIRVINSDLGKEAAAILIDGGLKLVAAILEEGKATKVKVSRGTDTKTGELKKPKINSIGLKELLDAGIYAGGELLPVAKNTYDRFYVGGGQFIAESQKSKVTVIPAKVDKVTKKKSLNQLKKR